MLTKMSLAPVTGFDKQGYLRSEFLCDFFSTLDIIVPDSHKCTIFANELLEEWKNGFYLQKWRTRLPPAIGLVPLRFHSHLEK